MPGKVTVMFGFKTTFALAAAAAVCVAGAPVTDALAQGQSVCGKRPDIITQLERKYGETRQSVGVQQNRGVVEVYASPESGSWTIIITDPRGLTCLIAAGEAFEIEKVSKLDTPT